MPGTIQALLIFVLAVLPGALYTWAFERRVGRWGVGLADRVLRFIGVSAIFQAAYVWPLYWLRSHYVHHRVEPPGSGTARYENLIADGRHLPWWLYLLPLTYVVVPYGVG